MTQEKIEDYPQLSGASIDTLVALVERGPLDVGDLPSKVGRNELLELGYVSHILVKGEEGYNAATYAGAEAYKVHFGTYLNGKLEPASSIAEAKANRIARRFITNISGGRA